MQSDHAMDSGQHVEPEKDESQRKETLLSYAQHKGPPFSHSDHPFQLSRGISSGRRQDFLVTLTDPISFVNYSPVVEKQRIVNVLPNAEPVNANTSSSVGSGVWPQHTCYGRGPCCSFRGIAWLRREPFPVAELC